MATFSTKSLHFPGGVPKKQRTKKKNGLFRPRLRQKKSKILDSSGLAFAKTLKSLVFLFCLVPPQQMATFSTKSLHFPGGVPKNQNKKKIGLFRPRLRQDSRIFGFLVFFGTSSGNGNISFRGYSACSLQYLIVVEVTGKAQR